MPPLSPLSPLSPLPVQEDPPPISEAGTREGAIRSLRDEMRSARRWQDLLSSQERHLLLAEIARVALAIGQDLYPQNTLGDLDIR
ncbi:MAG: hypothetical protein H7Z41_11920, partial [Cytophagales bacterium]|nr:hypothetical protein [Armatimonadota bacterium]